MRNLIIFGVGHIADCVSYYFDNDDRFNIVGYCCDSEFLKDSTFKGKPVVSFDEVTTIFPSNTHSMFIAIGYHKLNQLRKEKFQLAQSLGYSLESYLGKNVAKPAKIGANCFIPDGSIIQPFVSIGHNSFIWGGAMIGHHVFIGDHCWITGSANIGGLSKINEECFIGLNATVSNNVTIGKRALLGANSFVNKDLHEESVVIVPGTEIFRLKIDNFLKISNSF